MWYVVLFYLLIVFLLIFGFKIFEQYFSENYFYVQLTLFVFILIFKIYGSAEVTNFLSVLFFINLVVICVYENSKNE